MGRLCRCQVMDHALCSYEWMLSGLAAILLEVPVPCVRHQAGACQLTECVFHNAVAAKQPWQVMISQVSGQWLVGF